MLKAYRDVVEFDRIAGHITNKKKLKAVASTVAAQGVLLRMKSEPSYGQLLQNLDIVDSEIVVGETILSKSGKVGNRMAAKVKRTVDVIRRISRIAVCKKLKKTALAVKALPKHTYGMMWVMPTKCAVQTIRSAALKSTLWTGRAMRASEVVLALINDPTRVDPWGAMIYHTARCAQSLQRCR